MPLYEYACISCHHHFDVRHVAGEKPALCCPECKGEVRRVYHASGIIFKGSGWYVTDSASKPSQPEARPAEEKSSDTATTTAAASAGESDTKAADPPAPKKDATPAAV